MTVCRFLSHSKITLQVIEHWHFPILWFSIRWGTKVDAFSFLGFSVFWVLQHIILKVDKLWQQKFIWQWLMERVSIVRKESHLTIFFWEATVIPNNSLFIESITMHHRECHAISVDLLKCWFFFNGKNGTGVICSLAFMERWCQRDGSEEPTGVRGQCWCWRESKQADWNA